MKNWMNLCLLIVVGIFSGCTTYRVAATTEAKDIYADAEGASVVYSAPAKSILLLKGNPKNGLVRVRYHSDPAWYWTSFSALTAVPGFNPKSYEEDYATYERGDVRGNSGYSATIQTGPRGGQYYINKNGNKTYVKKGGATGRTKSVGGRGSRGGRH